MNATPARSRADFLDGSILSCGGAVDSLAFEDGNWSAVPVSDEQTAPLRLGRPVRLVRCPLLCPLGADDLPKGH